MQLYIFLAAHFIADFTLQSAELAEKKTKKFRYLLKHALIYAVIMAVAMLFSIPVSLVWIPLGIIAVSHFLIDWIRVRCDKKYITPEAHFASFVADQILHILLVYGSIFVFHLNGQNTSWISAWMEQLPLNTIIRYVLIFIIITDPASVFVKKISIYISGGTNCNHTTEPPVGSIIGKLERFIIALLVLYGEIGAIGFVLTAKSLARFKQLENQDFAEKYLVGTLSSTAIAIAVTLLLK